MSHSHPKQEIAGGTVAEPLRARSTTGEHATDGCDISTRRIKRQKLSVITQVSVEAVERDARFNRDREIGRLVIKDVVQTVETQCQIIPRCEVAQGLSGTATPRHYSPTCVVSPRQRRRDFFWCTWRGYVLGASAVNDDGCSRHTARRMTGTDNIRERLERLVGH